MYQEFFGLRDLPFELTADPRYLYLSAKQREALSVLQYGLLSGKSLTLLVGEAGTGKTTLLRSALESERCRRVRAVYLNNPMLVPADFLALVARRFDLACDAASKSIVLEQLEARLLARAETGEVTALVVDEAQCLSTELLEEIRLLSNIEGRRGKLLPLVLAGQPELAERLERNELRQLKQRVALRCELEPFTLSDTASYIATRIHRAGGNPAALFSQEAVTLIHERSGGIPRTINVICDNALLGAMALVKKPVDRALVLEVCGDLRFNGSVDPQRPEPATAIPTPHPVRREDVAVTRAEEAMPLEEAGGDAGGPPDLEPDASGRFRFRFRWRSSASERPARILTE